MIDSPVGSDLVVGACAREARARMRAMAFINMHSYVQRTDVPPERRMRMACLMGVAVEATSLMAAEMEK